MDDEKKTILLKQAARKIIERWQKKKMNIKKESNWLSKRRGYLENSATKKMENFFDLVSEIKAYGGIWETIDDITINMKILSNEQKFDTLKCQINYRKIALKESLKGKKSKYSIIFI